MKKWSRETVTAVKRLSVMAVLLVIGYRCHGMLRFSAHVLNSIFSYALYALPLLAIRPMLQLPLRPRRWGLALLTPLLLLSSILSLGKFFFEGMLGVTEHTETLQAVQQGSSTIELQRYENGGAVGVHGLNLEQHRLIFPSLYLVKSVDFFDSARDGTLSVEGPYTVRVHARGSYGSNNAQFDRLYHLKPWVYF